MVNKMKFIDIMSRVSMIMEIEEGSVPFDKQIAKELGQSSTQYANNKKRNKIPYEDIAIFCNKYEITINWVLLGKSSISLIQKEEELYKIGFLEKVNTCTKIAS